MENTESAIKNEQPREASTRRRKTNSIKHYILVQ